MTDRRVLALASDLGCSGGCSVETLGWAILEAEERSGRCAGWISGAVLFGEAAKGRLARPIVIEVVPCLFAVWYLEDVDYRTVRRNRLLEKTLADTMSF